MVNIYYWVHSSGWVGGGVVEDEKNWFWRDIVEVQLEFIYVNKIVIGWDSNGHEGKGN